MYKSLVMFAAALVILSAGSLMNRAEAGASASAPTKYSRASSAGYQAWTGWLRTRRANGTSEYSSSNRSPRR
jgi:hypothetical protein